MPIETVRIKHGDSYLVLNKRDLDRRKHHVIDEEIPNEIPEEEVKKPKAKKKRADISGK